MTLVLIEKGPHFGGLIFKHRGQLGSRMLYVGVFFHSTLEGRFSLMFWFILSVYLWTLRGSECGGLLEKKFHVTVTVDDLCLIEKRVGWCLMLVFLPIASMYLCIIYLIYLPTLIVDFVDVLLFLSHICMWYICLQWILDFCGKCR